MMNEGIPLWGCIEICHWRVKQHVGGGILGAPFACSTVARGVKDAAPYEL